MLVDIKVLFRVELIDDCLEPRERELVAIFKVTVVLTVLLDCVVSQVHKGVVYVGYIDRKLRRTRPQVTFFEEQKVMILSEADPDSDVELALENKQWSLDVLLDDKGVVADFVSVLLAFLLARAFLRLLHVAILLASLWGVFFFVLGLLRCVFLLQRLLLTTLTVLLDELVQSVKVVEDVDTSASVEMRWLQQPQVIRVEVAHRHRVSRRRPLFEIKRFKLCYSARIGRVLQAAAGH